MKTTVTEAQRLAAAVFSATEALIVAIRAACHAGLTVNIDICRESILPVVTATVSVSPDDLVPE